MGAYNSLIKPLLFNFDPESVHDAAKKVLAASQVIPGVSSVVQDILEHRSSLLKQNLWGIDFSNPIGVAAGFDKNAEVCDSLLSLGFGFMEIGSVSNGTCSGNPKPRLFRLADDSALINRMGLNNLGIDQVLRNLHLVKSKKPIFVNISKTNDGSLTGPAAITDICECYSVIGSSAKVVVLNLSCPNTKDGQTFESPEVFLDLLKEFMAVKSTNKFTSPVLVKVSNDIDQESLKNIIEKSLELGVEGFVVTNTSVKRDGLATGVGQLEAIGKGGLSGRPVFERALALVSKVSDMSEARVPIIGVGGIFTANDAIKMLKAGASLVEVYTGLVYEGPMMARRICEGIEKEIIDKGLLSITELKLLKA